MSTKTQRFVWNEEEKDWLKSWQPKLRRDVNKLTEQVSRFKKALPDFAQEAENVADPILHSGWRLLRLSWKNKFNSLSAEAARAELKASNEQFGTWARFTSRADISNAIKGVNSTVRTRKREQQQALKKAEQIFLARIGTEEFARSIEITVAMVTQEIRQMAILARSLEGYGTENDLPLLQRLLLVHFVRCTCEFDQEVRATLARFLSTTPLATAEDLLGCVIRSVVIETTTKHLHNPRALAPGINDPKSLIVIYLAQVFESLLKSLKEWKLRGVAPTGIDTGYFAVQGVDFSLGTRTA